MLRVLAWLPYATGRVPGQRYRLEQWAPLLRADGIEVRFSPFLSGPATDALYRSGHVLAKTRAALAGYAQRYHEAVADDGFDVVYVYREAGPLGTHWLEKRVTRRVPLVFDFDDAIYLPAANAPNRWAQVLKRPAKVRDICRIARHVTVGNETLAAFAREHAEHVTILPSTIDTARYAMRERPANPRPVVGWTGSVSTVPYLQRLVPALVRLRRRVDFSLRVVGPALEAPGLDVQWLPWREATEVEDLRPMDVGLMPLPDDDWSKGKCGMKALQYMALAIPPVVSPIGVNAEIVRDGISGFHARTEDEWVDRVGALLDSPERRRAMGAAARRTVEEAFSASLHAPRLAAVLREAVRGS